MADFKLHYYLLANNSKVHWYATSHSSSNMVTLVAADIWTRTSQQVAVKLSLESLILGCLILIPISSAQICGSFFSTLCTHPRSYLKKQSKTGNLSCQCLRLWKGEQVTLGSPQHLICKTKAHPLDQGWDMLEFIKSSISCLLCHLPTPIKVQLTQKTSDITM